MSAFAPGEIVTFDFDIHHLPYGVKEGVVLWYYRDNSPTVGVQFDFFFEEGHACHSITTPHGSYGYCRWILEEDLKPGHEPDWYIENNLPVPGHV